MVTIRSDKYELRRVVNGLVGYSKIGKSETLYTQALKYVDVSSDSIWLINADKMTCEPTHGTLKRVESNKVTAAAMSISRQLNDESMAIPHSYEIA